MVPDGQPTAAIPGENAPVERQQAANVLRRYFGPDLTSSFLWARWAFLRALGMIFFSAFYPLLLEITGMIGPNGLIPATGYLQAVREALPTRFLWYAPTLFWFNASDRALLTVVVVGLLASLTLVLNFWPRLSVAVAIVCFLSFVAATEVFSSYQSDGMLLEAAFISLFLAPPGLRPGLGVRNPPSRASLFLLQWEWFRIYFESGLVKVMSGEPQWRNLTAMDKYYENGPLPTWIAWYADKLPHAAHMATAASVLIVELFVVWLMFIPAWAAHAARARQIFEGAPEVLDRASTPRNVRLAVFAVTTLLQLGIILTANYAFLNFIVIALGIVFLDDVTLSRLGLPPPASGEIRRSGSWKVAVSAFFLSWIFYATIAGFMMIGAGGGVLTMPAVALAPFRFANNYGLFAVMTRNRYEIEFQGSEDGQRWLAYPFRFKPQSLTEAPGIYAPYQPRFEWNLWFASLGGWEENRWVVSVERRLAQRSPAVLRLFRNDPLAGKTPRYVRSVLWRYRFSDRRTKERTGAWWQREPLGVFAPPIERLPDGKILVRQ